MSAKQRGIQGKAKQQTLDGNLSIENVRTIDSDSGDQGCKVNPQVIIEGSNTLQAFCGAWSAIFEFSPEPVAGSEGIEEVKKSLIAATLSPHWFQSTLNNGIALQSAAYSKGHI